MGPCFLKKYAVSKEIVDSVCFLIANHHSYKESLSIEHQILIEADFLVNIFEKQWLQKQIEKMRDWVFRTETGISLLETMFLVAMD